MPRNLAGCDQHSVKANVAFSILRMRRKPCPGGLRDAALLTRQNRVGRVVEGIARLHLDEHQNAEAPRDNVDLADRTAEAPCDDAITLGDEVGRGAALCRQGR